MEKIIKILIPLLFTFLHAENNWKESKWNDFKEIPYNKLVIPKNYNKVGIKEKIKEVEGEEIWYFSSGYPKHISKIKGRLFKKNKREVRYIGYVENTGKKWTEDRYFYADDNASRDYLKITRMYFNSGKIKEEYRRFGKSYISSETFGENGRHTKGVYRKAFWENGKLRYCTNFSQTNPDFKFSENRNEDGSLNFKVWCDKERQYPLCYKKEYQNKILRKEYTYLHKSWGEHINHGFYSTYDENGTLVSEKFFDDGRYSYGSYCPFDTTPYLYKLNSKYKIELTEYRKKDTHCQLIDKDTYAIATIFRRRDDLRDKSLLIATIDISNKVITNSILNSDTHFNVEQDINYFIKDSFKAKQKREVYDFINYDNANQNLLSYEITKDDITFIEDRTNDLKYIIKNVKDNQPLSLNNLEILLKETKVDYHTVESYHELAFVLQKSGQHTSAIKILSQIIERYPNRAKAYLDMADSLYKIANKKSTKSYYADYIKWMKFYQQSEKIPKRVFQRIKR